MSLFLAIGSPMFEAGQMAAQETAVKQAGIVTGVVKDGEGAPLIGASVLVKGTNNGVVTDFDGNFSIKAPVGSELVISYVGQPNQTIKVTSETSYDVVMSSSQNLDEVVVTALGIKKDKKSLGYSVDDIDSEELMRNKTSNPINSLSGKIAGVNVTQSSGAAGSGAQIILRGGTSLERDNQPLFVVDGVIYDNSTSSIGNSAFDGMTTTSTTNSNRVMDINPEDIENMSILKGPAASALYGSKASAGVVIITTKKGKEGAVEVNLSAKYTSSWAANLPETQTKYKQGYYEDQYDADGNYTGTVVNDFSYSSWGEEYAAGETAYDNIGNFFETGTVWDTNLSVSGGNENGNFFLSGSYYDQDGIIPTTGYTKATFRFNGEQKFKMFTFGANAAYSQANTTKTLTSAGLYGSSGTGALVSLYTWSPSTDMTHYLNDDGSRYQMFGDRLDAADEKENPYWILNENQLTDDTERFTGNFNVKADITDWWWVSYRMGIDSYTTSNSTFIAPGGAIGLTYQNGMMSENSYRYQYLSTNLLTNFNKQFGDFNLNLLLGTSTEATDGYTNYKMAYDFEIPGFYAFSNVADGNSDFSTSESQKRLVGVFGEFRVDWKNMLFLTVTGRNDWTSTLPEENNSYFYPSVGGSFVFTELMDPSDILSFGKIRASWARVGKDAAAYATNTYTWDVATFLGGITGVGNSWTRGNPYLEPEMTESTEIGIEARFLNNRLKVDYAFYTNNSFNQILSPRGPQSTGYIFCSVNAGDVYNKGMELSISGTPIQTKDWTWESSFNISGNRGTVENLLDGTEILYVTDVQIGNAKAASFNGGNFMAISGSVWTKVADYTYTDADGNEKTVSYGDLDGQTVLDTNGMPTSDGLTTYEIGNREATFSGGWNNTVTYKDWSFNMMWEYSVGADVYNGTDYAMTIAGTSELSADRESITITGVEQTGTDATTGAPIYETKEYTYNSDGVYTFNGVSTSGKTIISNYYQDYYATESANFMTNVKSLRLRTLALSYNMPKSILAKQNVIKRAMFTVSANNVLLFTNYNGDPEVAASGSGAVGSSSVGMDYCGVPSTSSISLGVNLTF